MAKFILCNAARYKAEIKEEDFLILMVNAEHIVTLHQDVFQITASCGAPYSRVGLYAELDAGKTGEESKLIIFMTFNEFKKALEQ